MMLTTGALLNRLERDHHADEKFTFMMPTASGPCRFGVYNVLHKIILEKTGWKKRVRVFSSDDGDYFRETSAEFSVKLWCGFAAFDLLQAMLHDVRPVERTKGAADRVFRRAQQELLACMERPSGGTASVTGDPIDTEALDRFAYDIHEAHRRGIGKDYGTVLRSFGAAPTGAADSPTLVPLRVPDESRERKTPGPRAMD